MINASDDRARGARWREGCLLAGIFLAVAWFDVWTVRSSGDKWKFGEEQEDYYNLLIDGYLAGQLNMKVEVPEALLKLSDPYDPQQRPVGLGLHDASFYKGKYYVYFGAAPMVVLMLPFRLLTGTDLPLGPTVIVFVYGGFLASAATWLALRRRYFPEVGMVVSALCVLALGLAGLGPVLLRRPHMWELPIGAGYCFAMLTLWCVFHTLHSAERRAWWLAGAGLSLGLAIASRPTYLLALPLLGLPLAWWWRMDVRMPWRLALCGAAPLAFIGGLMAWHNYLRFDDPLQFGQAYQFSMDYESKMAHFRPGYVPFNGYVYFFSAARWQAYFPFVQPAELPPKPAGFGGNDGVFGVMANLPLAWLAFAAPLALRGRERVERGRLLAWFGTAAVLFAAMAGVLLCFFGSLARYLLDFTPTLMLLAVVGVLGCERALRGCAWSWPRWLGRALWGGALVFSAGFGVLFSLQLDGRLRERNPAKYAEVARLMNRVPALVEKLAGVQHGTLELALRLPAKREAGEETLLVCGVPPLLDRVLLRHGGDGREQIGFAHGEAPVQWSRPLALAADRTHRVRVAMGSLYPPATHPFFADKPPAEAVRLTRRLRIEVNGEPALEGHYRFASGGALHTSGAVESVRRVELEKEPVRAASSFASDPAAGAGDTLRLRVKWPQASVGAREPLVVTGQNGGGDLLLVEYSGGDTVRFFLDHWGGPLVASETVRLDFGVEHVVEIGMASLATVPDVSLERVLRRGRLRVVVDGQTLLDRVAEFYTAETGEVAIGRNAIGGTGCAPEFTGELLAAERLVRE